MDFGNVNWDAVAAIAETAGAVGVIGSLIFVGFQIRRDARARRAQTIHQQTEAYCNVIREFVTTSEIPELLFRGMHDFSALMPVETVRFMAHHVRMFRIFEDTYLQHKEGHLEARLWTGFEAPLDDILGYPGSRAFWRLRSHWFSGEFQALVEAKIAEHREGKLWPITAGESLPATATTAATAPAGGTATHSGG